MIFAYILKQRFSGGLQLVNVLVINNTFIYSIHINDFHIND